MLDIPPSLFAKLYIIISTPLSIYGIVAFFSDLGETISNLKDDEDDDNIDYGIGVGSG